MTDHGPQRQPASDPYNSPEWRAKFRSDCNHLAAEAKQEHDAELASLRAEVEWLRQEHDEDAEIIRRQGIALADVLERCDRLRAEIGRLRACLEEIEAWRIYELPSKLAADALRGEEKSDE